MGTLSRFVAVVIVALSAVLGFAVPVFAQTGTPAAPTDLSSLLLWIAAGGGAMAVVSWLCERWAWFQAQAGTHKSVLILILSGVLAVVSRLLLDTLPDNIVTMLSPYATALIGLFTIWSASQGAYTIQKSAKNPTASKVEDSTVLGVAINGDVKRSNVVTAGHDAENHS